MAIHIAALNGQPGVEGVDAVFGQTYNETLIHQLVVKYLAGARAGTKAQKSRSDVSGGGTKPWRQKGTGRARSGSSRSPIWRTGGVTFAARPRNFAQKLNKKMHRAGIRSILSELVRQNRLVVSDNIVPKTPKTKEACALLKGIDARRILLVVDKMDPNLALATRNIPDVEVTDTTNLSPVLLVGAEKVIATSAAIKRIEERLG